MKSLALKIFDWVVFILALIIVLLAVLLSLARLFLPHMTQYQPRVQQWASQAIHQPVQIGQMTAAWRGLEPEFKFQQVAILSSDGTRTLLEVKELGVGIDLFKSLLKWQIVPGWVIVSGANLSLHQDATGKITLNGISAPQKNDNDSAVQFREFGDWLLAQNRIYLEHINATWYGKDGRIIPFRHLQLKLINTFLSHSLIGGGEVAQLPQSSRFNFVVNLSGDFEKKDFKAKLYLNAKKVPLGIWLANHIPNLAVTHGIGNVQLWANWNEGQLQELQSKFFIENVGLKSKYLLQDVVMNFFNGEFDWQRQQQGWDLTATNSRLDLNGMLLPKTHFTIHATAAKNSQPATQVFQTDVLDLENVKNILFLTTFLATHNRDVLNQINPSGELKNVTLVHTDLAQSSLKNQQWSPAEFSFISDFNDVSWLRWQKIPGVTNLSGIVHATPMGGTLAIDAKDTLWDFGTLFRQFIPLDDLHGNVQWQKNSEGWQIEANDVNAANSLISINGNISYFLPADKSSPIVNVLAGFNLGDPVQAVKYMPVGIMPKAVIDWLDQAIIAGKNGSGKLVLSGPIKSFPFKHEEGRFLIDSQLNNLTLNYRFGWPQIEGINGEITFDDNSMTVNTTAGKIYGAQLTNTQAVIPDLSNPVLQVNGQVQGDLNDGLKFLQESPLYNTIGKRIAGFEMSGPMNLNLQLTVPLKDDENVTVQGNIVIPKGDLQLPEWWNLHVENLGGNLQFTEKSLSGNLQGQLFNQPINVKIATLTPTPKTTLTQFDLGTGQMTLAEIAERFDLPKLKYVDGTLNYHALLQFSNTAAVMNSLIVDSNLQGITVALPAPLAKNANDIVPSELQLQFNTGKKLQLLLNYGKRLSTALTFLKNIQGKFNLVGGEVSFGGKQANIQSQPGLVINGYLPNFVWDDWKPYFTNGLAVNSKRPPALLRSIDLTFDQFTALGLSLAKVELQLQPGQGNWNVGIHSSNIDGQFTVPYNFPRGVLVGNFQRLYIGTSLPTTKTNILPKDVPAFNITCQDFRYGDKSFGKVNLKVTPSHNALSIDQLNVSSQGLDLVANGEWRGTSSSQQTSLDGKLTAKDLGEFLKNWNITKNLVAGNGSADFSLQWPGPAYQFSLKNIDGELSLRFFNGRIINLSSSTETELGLGRVLNLLSLQTLPRRMRLDFSDITDSGFSFDVIKGDFSLTQGNAFTTNAYIDGPLAKIVIKGRIGLSSQDYNLTLVVTPYVTSNIPTVVATVAGGPIAGAVTWVASKVFSTAVKELVTYTYQVTGSWDNPSIVKITAAERLQLEKDNNYLGDAKFSQLNVPSK